MRRPLVHWLGNSLIVAGLVLLVGTGGLVVYSQYEEYLASQDAALFIPPPQIYSTLTPAPTPMPTDTPASVSEFTGANVAEGTSRLLPTSTNTPVSTTVTPTTVVVFPAERVVAPAIGLDTRVVESHLVNGEWQVPKFVAGHLEGTSLPLEGGNIVLSGHVQSLSSGNVFAKIGGLHVGDSIRVYTQVATIIYVVSKVDVVSNRDVSVVRPTPNERLTLITCTGRWLPLQRDYDSRLVVVANRQT